MSLLLATQDVGPSVWVLGGVPALRGENHPGNPCDAPSQLSASPVRDFGVRN